MRTKMKSQYRPYIDREKPLSKPFLLLHFSKNKSLHLGTILQIIAFFKTSADFGKAKFAKNQYHYIMIIKVAGLLFQNLHGI